MFKFYKVCFRKKPSFSLFHCGNPIDQVHVTLTTTKAVLEFLSCPYQSGSELLLTPDWPVGDISETLSRKVPSELLNTDREGVSLATFEGKQFPKSL